MAGETKRVEDMNYFELLAWLGIGSSHPGGFLATKQNFDIVKLKSDDSVLDAGCGSGLTACYLAKKVGCKITGIDISSQMVEKANLRAKKEGVTHLVEFKVADVYQLPFAENSFDWVIAESVSVFLDKAKVYREFYRVLKPLGQVADLEMSLLKELPGTLKRQLEQYYGAGINPLSYEAWRETLTQAGFQEVEIKNPQPLKNNSNVLVEELKKDWVLILDLVDKVKKQPGLVSRLQKNAGYMKKNQSYFGFGLVYGRKPPAPTPKKSGLKSILSPLQFKAWIWHLFFPSSPPRSRVPRQ